MLPRLAPVALAMLLLAGCLARPSPVETASAIEAAPIVAHGGLREAALALDLPPRSAGALFVEIGVDDWFYNEAWSVYQASLLVEIAGFSRDAIVALGSWSVNGTEASRGGAAVFTGERSVVLGHSFTEAEPLNLTLLLIVATDEEASTLEARVGVADNSIAGLPERETRATWAQLGEGPRLSYWIVYEDLPFGFAFSRDVEIADERTTTPVGVAAQGTLSVVARHDLGAPGIHESFVSETNRGGSTAWSFTRALDDEEETVSGEMRNVPVIGFPLTGVSLAIAHGAFNESAAASASWDVDAEIAPFRAFVALSFPIDPAGLSLTFERSVKGSGGSYLLSTPAGGVIVEEGTARALPPGEERRAYVISP